MASQSPDIKEAMNREFARMSGMLYDLNPRNFEDRWYALVGIELNRLCRKIKCNAIATAQDSIWAGNTYNDSIKLADVRFGPVDDDANSGSADAGAQNPDESVPSAENDHASRGAGARAEEGDTYVDDLNPGESELVAQLEMGTFDPDIARAPLAGRSEQENTSPAGPPYDAASSASQATQGGVQTHEVQQGEPSHQTRSRGSNQPYQPSMSACTVTGGNRHRVPDSAINGYVSIDFDFDKMKKAIEEREQWTAAAVGERQAQPSPPSGATNNAMDSQSGAAQAEVTQQDAQNKESKPVRRPLVMDCSTGAIHDELEKLPRTDPDDFDALLNPLPLYRDHDGLVVEFKILNAESKRLPSRQQSATTAPTFDASLNNLMKSAQIGNLEQIRVFFASPHWNHQKSIMLLATAGDFGTHTIATRVPKAKRPTFTIQPWSHPPRGNEVIRRSLERQERQKTPPEDGNADGGDGPTGPPGPPGPPGPADPKTRKRKRDASNTEKPRRSNRNRTGNPYARTNAQNSNEHADAPPTPRTGDESGTNHGRPPQDTANRAAAQPGPSGIPESASRAPPTRRTKSMPRLLGNSDSGNSKGKGKARADPVVENERTSGNPPFSLAPISETDEGAGANEDMDIDEDQPARKKARTRRPSEGPSSSSLSSCASDDEEAQPAASTSTAVQEPIGYTHTGRPIFPPPPVFDAPGKKASQKAKVSQKAKKKLTRSKTARN